MSVNIEEKIKNYRTAPFDARFPNTNQTRNCYQNYLDYHRCKKVLSAKNQKTTPCEWYHRVYKSLCPMAWRHRLQSSVSQALCSLLPFEPAQSKQFGSEMG